MSMSNELQDAIVVSDGWVAAHSLVMKCKFACMAPPATATADNQVAPRHAQPPSIPTPTCLPTPPIYSTTTHPRVSSIYFDPLSCIPITMSTFDQTKDTTGQKAQETKDLGQEKASRQGRPGQRRDRERAAADWRLCHTQAVADHQSTRQQTTKPLNYVTNCVAHMSIAEFYYVPAAPYIYLLALQYCFSDRTM
jgi:hypothetical protein